MTMIERDLWMAAAGLLAGAMNAMAGGGSFVTLPALIALGVPSVVANASSTVALWPAGAASVWVYRRGLRPVAGIPVAAMLAVTVAGGGLGAWLLLRTPGHLFDRLLPWLLLVATLTLLVAPHVVRNGTVRNGGAMPLGRGAAFVLQALLGIYGGYYGGAVGLMMLAGWSLIDRGDIKSLNAPRTLMVTAANGIAVLYFAMVGSVDWRAAAWVAAGAIVGGYAAARIATRLPSAAIRIVTLIACGLITVLFFLRAYA